jgi:feruloyl esterase
MIFTASHVLACYIRLLHTMRATLLLTIFCIAQSSLALTAGREKRCSRFASDVDFDDYHATHLNSTYHAARTVQVANGTSNISNDIPFCETYVSINYAKDAHLVFALWLPDNTHYTRRFLAVGNGGYSGLIDTANMMAQLNLGLGFAVAGGDAGHDAYAETNGTTNGYPGLVIPFLRRAVTTKALIRNAISIFTPLAKSLTAKYYGNEPRYSYFNGCSVGGAQGLALARYHPELYDGIHSGAPGADHDNMILSFLWNHRAQANNVLPQDVLDLVTNAVLDLCDSQDGVNDRLLANPLACPFHIGSLACNGTSAQTNSTACLTETQLAAFKAMYAGPQTSDTHEQTYPGYDLGSEVEWSFPIKNGLSELYAVPMLQNLVYRDPTWDPTTFNFTSAKVDYVEERAGPLIDVSDTNLSVYKARSGKILGTHGWADQLLTPLWTVGYRQRVEERLGEIDDLYRLFMVPGGGHCGVAQGYPQAPVNLHVMAPLIDWVERGIRPQSVLASDPQDGSGRTRKLCPWPQAAKYEGGDTDDWQSFVCT